MTASNDTPTGSPSGSPDTTAAAYRCAACGAELSASAKFCHACGASVVAFSRDDLHEADAPIVTGGRGASLPWILALVGLVGGSAYVSAREPDPVAAAPGGMVAPFAQGGGGGGATPDIAAMTPNERANRLYGRIMGYVQRGNVDSAAIFVPMGLAAHEMLEGASIDERYHYGQLGEMVGNAALAQAQADTILAAEPDHLLGLILGARVARMNNAPAKAKPYDTKLLTVLEKELATRKPEYEIHRAEIDRAVEDARKP